MEQKDVVKLLEGAATLLALSEHDEDRMCAEAFIRKALRGLELIRQGGA